MGWLEELQEAFSQLSQGTRAQVRFVDRADTVGEIGRAFNALAAELALTGPDGQTREQLHRLRNRLAGILAALHVMRETGALRAHEQETLSRLLAQVRRLEARWRNP